MTHRTPVVFTNGNGDIEQLALTNRWRVVTTHDNLLKLDAVDEMVGMPASSMRIREGALQPPEAGQWSNVLSWISRHVHQPMLVVGPNHPANDLALWANKALNWPHAVWLDEVYPALTPSAMALVNSATGAVYTSPEARASFTGRWPAPVTTLPHTSLVHVRRSRAPETVLRQEGLTRVLLVAYYAGTSPTVGVQRVNYWFEQVEKLSGGSMTVDLALATQWPNAPARVHHVPDLGPAAVCDARGGGLSAWGAQFLEQVNEAARSYSQDGAFWHLGLERYFDGRSDEYDVVICSGNPFTVFEFAKYAKRRWYAKTILDYRDPFALNPRVAFSDEQRAAAAYAEAGFNFAADRITVVNEVCAGLAVNPIPESDPVVIRNGWDDRLPFVRSRRPEEEASLLRHPKLVHAGQFYVVTPPDALISAVGSSGAELNQFGRMVGERAEGVVNHGRVPRDELLEQLSQMDCGVTFSSSAGFETPTKVFDYLATGLDVLVLYEGSTEGSALQALLADVDGVHWVPNETAAIRDWLQSYEPLRHDDDERAQRFSRRTSTLKLIGLVRELNDHGFQAPEQTPSSTQEPAHAPEAPSVHSTENSGRPT